MRHGGIVLAAGASSRMGRPKALLETADGPLAAHQARLLRDAGCSRVVLVLGADYEKIVPHLPLPAGQIVRNRAWREGRLTSITAGVKACGRMDGYLIFPVDTVGVRQATVRRVLRAADTAGRDAVRPFHNGAKGNFLWISAAAAEELARLVRRDPDLRVDSWVKGRAYAVDVGDAAVLSNINTPEDWEKHRP